MNNFTPRAEEVLTIARAESKALKNGYIGTGHLLLGLMQSDGIGSQILREAGFDLELARKKVIESTTYKT